MTLKDCLAIMKDGPKPKFGAKKEVAKPAKKVAKKATAKKPAVKKPSAAGKVVKKK